MSASVAWVSALIGLKVTFPQSFSQISPRMSALTGALKPALERASDNLWMRSDFDPSGSPRRETVALHDLHDSGRDKLRSRIDDRADDAIGPDIGCDLPIRVSGGDRTAFEWTLQPMEIPPGNPVLQRDDSRAFIEEARQLVSDWRDLMSFEGEKHEIMRRGFPYS